MSPNTAAAGLATVILCWSLVVHGVQGLENCNIGKAGLCGRSTDRDGNCFPRATYAGAVALCDATGARLCTPKELLEDEVAYTGCNFNSRRVWSSGPCSGGHRILTGATPFALAKPERCCPDERKRNVRCCFWSLTPSTAPEGDRPFQIHLRNRGGFSEPEMKMFEEATARWEKIIKGIKGDNGVVVNMTDEVYNGEVNGLLIDVTKDAQDGPGGILGTGGPRKVREENLIPYYGVIKLDSADVERAGIGALRNIAVHEVAHVLGLGTTWDWWRNEGRYIKGRRFTGANAIREYEIARGGLLDNKGVPLADTGSAGTIGAHWKEATFREEIFTGYISTSESIDLPISRVTAGALEDLGYVVSYDAAADISISLGLPTVVQPVLNDTPLVAFSGPPGLQFYGIDKHMLLAGPTDVLPRVPVVAQNHDHRMVTSALENI